MAAWWIPYFLIGLFILFVISGMYAWKHKEEIFEIAGLDLPPQLQGKVNKKKAAAHGPRPNAKAKNRFKVTKKTVPEPQEAPIKRTKKPAVPKPKSKPKKEIADNGEEERISDLAIETKGAPLSAFCMNQNGTLLICNGKDHKSFLFAIGSLDYKLYPLEQFFELDPNQDINHVATLIDEVKGLRIVYSLLHQKTIVEAKIDFREEDAQAVPTLTNLSIPNAFKNTIQKLVCDPLSRYIITLTDSSTITVYDEDGKKVFQQVFEQKHCSDFIFTRNFETFILAQGSKLEVFSIITSPTFSLIPLTTLSVTASINSVTYSEFTHQIICSSLDGIITIFKEKMAEGHKARLNSKGVRIVRASPTSEYLAIISGCSKLQIADLKTTALYAQLDTVHKGEIHFAEWNLSGSWLFFGSKQFPNIECINFNTDEKK